MIAGYRSISRSPFRSYYIGIIRAPLCIVSLLNTVRQMIVKDSYCPNLTPKVRIRHRSMIWSYPMLLPGRLKMRGKRDSQGTSSRIGKTDTIGSRRVERENGLETKKENHVPNHIRKRIKRDQILHKVVGGIVRKGIDTPSHHDHYNNIKWNYHYNSIKRNHLWIIGNEWSC